MSDVKLTLEPELETPAPGIPTLTLDGVEEEKPVAPEKKEEKQPEVQLTPEEQKVVDDFAEKIDITSSALVMQYGSGAQKKIANFSDTALANVRTKDLGEVGDEIANLVVELKSFDAGEEEKGFLGFFKKQANRLDGMKARYDKAEVNVNKIASSLEGHQVQLMKDIVMLDKLYETNLAYHKELSMYILAGKKRLKRERETTLEELKAKAQRSGLAEDAQAANDFAQQCDSFEKKLHDLELTRMVSVQMSPQIRLVQNNDRLMAEKIQSTIVNTIPLWKSQMVLALGVAHSADAVRAQREVTDMTNELLRKNAEKLKMSTIETARESERGIVDMETLRQTNQSLISTLDEVVKIQEEGKTRRREAEQELGRLENELKQKLLDIRA
ncbi:MAG: toxic anion resistance protein [Clostridiales bacterium]|nr:toxic anion resistance protein [Clostridiales bacterium]